jgi:hypothetical protein
MMWRFWTRMSPMRAPEQLAETFLGAPLDRQAEARRRWDVAGDDLEQAADEPVRRVRDEPDAPAGRSGHRGFG